MAKKTKKNNSPLFKILIALIFVAVGYFVYRFTNFYFPKTQLNPSSSSVWVDNFPNNSESTYVSNNLGISLKHLSGGQGNIAEKGDKIFIGFQNNAPPETGQWVEVFTKDPNQNLQEAIQQQILSSYPSVLCKVKIIDMTAYGSYYNKSYVYARIVVDLDPGDQKTLIDVVAKNCPIEYTVVSGERYFMMDPNHPFKMLFFNIGQEIIPTKTGPWQTTVTIN